MTNNMQLNPALMTSSPPGSSLAFEATVPKKSRNQMSTGSGWNGSDHKKREAGWATPGLKRMGEHSSCAF